jgi:hypothetical protein
MQANYSYEVKNIQIQLILRVLSNCYAGLCFVNSEICLDDSFVMSVYSRRGRQFVWELPDERCTTHRETAAKAHGITDMDAAYDDDEIRSTAESGMLKEALLHWDSRVLRDLRRAPSNRPTNTRPS